MMKGLALACAFVAVAPLLAFRAKAELASNGYFPTGCRRDGSILEKNVTSGGKTFLELKFLHQGRCRAGLVHAPSRGKGPWPVIYYFHGSGKAKKSAVQMASGGCSRWCSTYLCVYPLSDEEMRNGRKTGQFGWEHYDAQRTPGRKDVGFVHALHDAVSARWTLERTNVFGFGHSSGAAFVIGRLMYEANDIFRAIAATAGRLWPNMPFFQKREQWKSCSHVLYNYGGADSHGWEPGRHGLWGRNYGIEASAVRLARSNQCGVSASGKNDKSQKFQTNRPKHVIKTQSVRGHTLKRFVFPDCSNGQVVNFINWTDQEHGFRGVKADLDAKLR
jgi:poly(3-hydroxybutyrate) depolymerase